MTETEATTENGIDATLADYDADTDDYPETCPHGVDLRFFSAPDEMACFECWSAREEGR